MQQVIQIGTLSVFMTYALNLMEPIQMIIETISALIGIRSILNVLPRLLETESDVVDTPEVIEKYGDTFHPKKKTGRNYMAM